MKVTKTVFITYASDDASPDISERLRVDSLDWASFIDPCGRLAVTSLDIEVEVPDNILEIATEGLEQALQKMRAEHHQKEQEIINRIADLRLLAAPESVVLDDRDLTGTQKSKFNDSDAVDGDFFKSIT